LQTKCRSWGLRKWDRLGLAGALAAAGLEIVLNRLGKPKEMLVGRRGDRPLVMKGLKEPRTFSFGRKRCWMS